MENIPIEEAMKFAATPMGQSFLQKLQQENGALLNSAMEKAQAGDYEQVKKMLSGLLQSPEGKALLENFRR